MSLALSDRAFSSEGRPGRYRSLQTLLALMVAGSLVGSVWLLPSRLERITAASERGDRPAIERELARATLKPSALGETQGLVDVALTMGRPDVAVGIIEQVLSREPNDLAAIRLLLEIQRQRHRMRDVAALDERIFRLGGDPEALREAAEIYASERMPAERLDALLRLESIRQATAADMSELTHRLFAAGSQRRALTMLMNWLSAQSGPLPPELVALAAGLATTNQDADEVAARLGALIGKSDGEGALHVLIQTFTERGRPELSLVAANAIGEPMLGRPGVALVLAQLEMTQGNLAPARQRLQDLAQRGELTAPGRAMLAELELQAGDLRRAVALIADLPVGMVSDLLARRVVDVAYLTHRQDALAPLSPDRLAAVSPGSAAVVALAQGDRKGAEALARSALADGSALSDLGPAFAGTVHSLGLERVAMVRLLAAARVGTLDDAALSLLLDVADAAPAERPALLAALRGQRDNSPAAGTAWAIVATRQHQGAEVTPWLRQQGQQLDMDGLINLLGAAQDAADPTLTRATVALLRDRTDLPNGWSTAELDFTADMAGQPTAAAIREGLALLGAPATGSAARDRIVARIVGSPGSGTLAAGLSRSPDAEKAAIWLSDAVGSSIRSELREQRIILLSSLSPQRAAAILADTWRSDPDRWLPVLVAALLNDGRTQEAAKVLSAGLRDVSPEHRDAALFDAMARVPGRDALTILRVGAAGGRKDWVSAYHDALARAGLTQELKADLRARAADPSLDAAGRRAIVASLLDLGDRDGAIDILTKIASGKPPADPDVTQLVYVWGPRANAAAIAWLRDRAATAPPATFPKWLEHLAYVGGNEAVIDLGESHPALLGSSSAAMQTYQSALASDHRASKLDLKSVLQAATTTATLTTVARSALENGDLSVAWRASSMAIERAPSDPAVILLAAQTAAAIRRSEDSARLYGRLLSLGPQPVDVTVDAGDALLTAKQPGAARQILRAALARQPETPPSLATARLRARTLLLLGQTADAQALLKTWLQRYPANAGLSADLLQAQMQASQGG